MIALRKITLTATILILTFTPLTRAELFIDSVSPDVGELGEDLSVTILGDGFDESTRVLMSLDVGNQADIVGSLATSSISYDVEVQGQTAYVAGWQDGFQIVEVSDPQDPAIVGSVDTPGAAMRVAVQDQTVYVADGWGGLQIIDASDPLNPVIVGSVDTPDVAADVAVLDEKAYVADEGGGLQVVDVSDPEYPVIVGSVDASSDANGVAVFDQTAYIATAGGNLEIVDVSVPYDPAIVGSVDVPDSAYGVAVLNHKAYVAAGCSGVQIIDVGDPQNPAIIGSVDTPGSAYDVAVPGTTAYVADKGAGLQIIDVSAPKNIPLLGSVHTPAYVKNVTVVDQTAYVANIGAGMTVIDVSDPRKPSILGSADTPAWTEDVAVQGNIAYMANHEMGLQTVDISVPQNPTILGSVRDPDYSSFKDVSVVGQTAYVAAEDGLKIVYVSRPTSPYILGSVDTPDTALGLSVYENLVFVAAAHSGLQVIHASDSRNPFILGSVDTPDYAWDVAVLGLFAYVADAESGLQIIDLDNLQSPEIIGSVETPDAAVDVVVLDQIAYVAADGSGIQVIDVNNPANPVIIDSVDTLYWARGLAVAGQMAYVAEGVSELMTIVPVPREVRPVQLIGPGELQVTLPSPSIAERCNIRVFNQADSDERVRAVSFLSPEAYEAQPEKKAIVAAGSTGDPSDRLAVPVRKCANYAYLALRSQGYSRDNIQFLAPHVGSDVDHDGVANDVDDVCTTATLSSAIVEWGADSSELIVFLVDHGGVGTFLANAGDIVQASDLDAWMDVAQWTIPGKAVLIYDACYSGSFLEHMDPPSGKYRYVISSCQADESAWFVIDGTLSFSYQFWASVFYNPNLYESFVDAKKMMLHETADSQGQTAILDANGDGVQSKEDIELASDFVIGRGWVGASTPPEIGEVSGEQVLSETFGASLWASNITALNAIERVWAVIVPPDFDYAADAEVTDLDTVELADPDQNGVYVGEYDQFFLSGSYDIFVYAIDVFGVFSLPKTTTVVVDVDPSAEGIVYVHSNGDCGVGREPCYDTVQQGLSQTGRDAFRIQIAQDDYYEDLTVANDSHYILSGGYDSEYAIQNGLSAIIGSLTIEKGRVEMENLALAGQ